MPLSCPLPKEKTKKQSLPPSHPSSKVAYSRDEDDFQLRFNVNLPTESEVFLAFAIPFSYRDTQCLLAHLDRTFAASSRVYLDLAKSNTEPGWGRNSAPSSLHLYQGDTAHLPNSETQSQSLSYQQQRSVGGTVSARGPAPVNGKLKGRSSVPGSGAASAAAAAAAAAAGSPHATAVNGSSNGNGNGNGTGARSSITAAVATAISKRTEDLNSRIYYRRQLLTRSLEGRRVELITITDAFGATDEPEVLTGGVCECRAMEPPAAVFPSKKVSAMQDPCD